MTSGTHFSKCLGHVTYLSIRISLANFISITTVDPTLFTNQLIVTILHDEDFGSFYLMSPLDTSYEKYIETSEDSGYNGVR